MCAVFRGGFDGPTTVWFTLFVWVVAPVEAVGTCSSTFMELEMLWRVGRGDGTLRSIVSSAFTRGGQL